MTRVVYYNLIPSPYFVERMNVLVKRGNLDVEAWFAARRTPDRSWVVDEREWLFPARYLTAGSDPGAAPVPIAELRSARPDVFVTFYGRTSFALGALAARAFARRVAVRAMVTYDTWVRRTPSKEFAKHLLFTAIDSAEVPGPDTVDMVGRYGLPPERALVVTQSVDVPHYASARAVPDTARAARRTALGLHGCVFLYVGRLHPDKGLRYLLDAYQMLVAEGEDVSLLVAGDGPEEAALKEFVATEPGVVSLGFVQGADLPEVYALADVFVFPTLGDPHGLVVEEAMAAGLPVISTASAGDIRLRLPDGEAGYVVPPADSRTLAERMRRLARDPALRRRQGETGARLASGRDHERYAEDFERFVEGTLALPARGTAQAVLARAAGRGLAAASRRPPAPVLAARQGSCSRDDGA